MTKRILALAFGLGFLCGLAVAEVHYKSIAVTTTSQTVPLGGVSSITIYNAGADAPAAATSASVYLAAGATLTYPSSSYTAISLIASASTATVHLYLP